MTDKRWALPAALGLFLTLLLSACAPGGAPAGGLILSEVMAKNNGALADDEGNYPDWIELHNPTDKAINLKGYSLTDDVRKKGKFVFPEMEIGAGDYLVVFASGTERVDAENRVVHMPFSINSQKEDIVLYDPHSREISRVEVRDLPDNTTCGPDAEGKTVYFKQPTPGAANAETYTPAVRGDGVAAADAKVRLNEYATKGSVTLADEDGEFTAWVELHNYGDKELSLASFTLSDDPAKTDKWMFPAVTIPAGGYQVVYLSGKTKAYTAGGPLHADFVLSGKEPSLTLYAADGKKVDDCTVNDLTSNLSCGRAAQDAGKWVFYPKPTPGKANDTQSFDSIDSARYPKHKEAVISEVAAVNRTGVKAANGRYYDYIELHNPTDKPVSLNGYRLSKQEAPAAYKTLPNVQLAPGEYKLVFCGDTDSYNTRTKEIFIAMGLGRYGEHLYLLAPDGRVVDDVQSGRLDDAQSSGRVSDADPQVYYFDKPTPGAANPAVGLKGPAPTPVFSAPSGYLEGGGKISITCPGATIRYTTDGSTPTASSPVYQGDIAVSGNVTIRARAYMDGRLPSEDSAGSYLVGRRHAMPVIFLSTDPANLFDYTTGILEKGPGYTDTFPHTGANFWKDWERPVHFEYVDENGVAQLEFNAGVKVFGQFSRAMDQKSLSINLRDRYGPKEFCYPLFGQSAATNVYSELVLRNAGQDGSHAHLRDAFVARAIKGQADVDFMDYRPVVVYINGAYYGLYDLREKICESYVSNRTGADEDAIDMIKGESILMSGSLTAYKELLQYVKTHDLSQQAHYDHVASLVDVDELIDYWIAISFFGNTDTGNIKFYRERTTGGKWRWVVFDQDWALWPSTHTWNMVEEIVNPNGHGVGHMFSTDLMRGLMHNTAFRDKFLSTYGKRLKTAYSTERLLSVFDAMVAEIRPEMPAHFERWPGLGNMATWEAKCRILRGIVEKRPAQIRQNVIETFSCTGVSARSRYAQPFKLSVEQVEALLG